MLVQRCSHVVLVDLILFSVYVYVCEGEWMQKQQEVGGGGRAEQAALGGDVGRSCSRWRGVDWAPTHSIACHSQGS